MIRLLHRGKLRQRGLAAARAPRAGQWPSCDANLRRRGGESETSQHTSPVLWRFKKPSPASLLNMFPCAHWPLRRPLGKYLLKYFARFWLGHLLFLHWFVRELSVCCNQSSTEIIGYCRYYLPLRTFISLMSRNISMWWNPTHQCLLLYSALAVSC